MIQQPARRAPHQGTPYQHAPNAALLIDFDNVTMGIRSDLGKELKSLLNSDVIRGKVAVQRAYADWRRYPQYIVPLAESSIDLIFAPAYGSSKKNATDLRMAIDAIELVFTRPEIGTFILMTGDSDFSSCVLKLKEYGKYVIGVGMRESSSDLLIQNCDEYYSYHALSGLTRADDVLESREDPWVLVKRAVQQMAANGDVMRTDRLKQVMLELDPGFDEKEIGYNKFSRFVHEAATKGVLRLKKGENGQFEIVVEDAAAPPASAERRPREAPTGSDGRQRRGRDRDQPRRDEPRREEVRREAPAAEAPMQRPVDEPAEQPVAREQERPTEQIAPRQQPAEPAAKGEPPTQVGPVQDLNAAYGLLQHAIQQLGGTSGKSVRDGDVKRRMLELAPGFDETTLGFSKFTRFLRQAHDAEAIDLQRVNGGNYEVSLSTSGKRFAAPASSTTGQARPAVTARAVERTPMEAAVAPAVAEASAVAPVEAPAAETPSPAPVSEVAAPAVVPVEAQAVRPGLGTVWGRRGGRGGAPEGPPPILPGQSIQVNRATPPAEAVVQAEAAALEEVAAPTAEPATAEEVTAKKARSRRGRRGRGRDRAEPGGDEEASTSQAEALEAPEQTDAAAPPRDTAPGAAASEPGTADATAEIAAAPQVTAAPRARRGRRGGRDAAEGPPPILPGQAVAPRLTPPAAEVPAAAEIAPEAAAAEAPGAEAEAPATDDQAAESAEARPAKKRRRSRGRGRQATAEAAAEPRAEEPTPEPQFSPADLGLPQDRDSIQNYFTAYKGVGRKTAESLTDAFGDDVFRVLEEDPERVTGLLGDRRAATVLESWTVDHARRRDESQSTAAEPAPEPDAAAEDAEATPKKARSRTRRGGRGRARKRTDPTPGS